MRLETFSVVASLAAAACGRTGLQDEPAPLTAVEDAHLPPVANTHPAVDASVPNFGGFPQPPPDAAPPSFPLCSLLPPQAARCPAAEPTRPDPCPVEGETCFYATNAGAVGRYTCIPGEGAPFWKKEELPCVKECLAEPSEAGGELLDAGACETRDAIVCAPSLGESVQELLDDQIFDAPCRHGEGAGGFVVRFDANGCPIRVSGGLASSCDLGWLSRQRFACAVGHPCAVAPRLVK